MTVFRSKVFHVLGLNDLSFRLATTLSRRHGAIDVLINNAGVSYAATSDVEEKSITEVNVSTVVEFAPSGIEYLN